MAKQLTTSSNSGIQSTTQSPQNSAGSSGPAAQVGSVQPGTAPNLLNTDKNGVALSNQSLSLVNLGARQSQISKFAPAPERHTNPALFGVSGLLFVIAVVMFYVTARAAKNTTE
jgi:hypothetical protein